MIRGRHVQTPDAPHCRRCFIRTFRSPAEATAAGALFQVSVNGAIGDLCFGCATEEKRLSYVEDQLIETRLMPANTCDKHKEKPMSKKEQPLFLDFEVGVREPPSGANSRRGRSKYEPIVQKILDIPLNGDGESAWCRFKLANDHRAKLITQHLSKLRSQRFKPEGHTVTCRVVPSEDDDETVWLYVQRLAYEPVETGEPDGS